MDVAIFKSMASTLSAEVSGSRMAKVFTIGFTQTTAEAFFERLFTNGVKRVIDVRLWNRSQLAGFAKADDLAWFLRKMGGIDYRHEPLMAPTDEMLAAYRGKKLAWSDYETSFLTLMQSREIEKRLDPALFADACLLCSEKQAHRCHRRLGIEYLAKKWGRGLEVKHL
jgi:uncharacterized protein (DUF488 family)